MASLFIYGYLENESDKLCCEKIDKLINTGTELKRTQTTISGGAIPSLSMELTDNEYNMSMEEILKKTNEYMIKDDKNDILAKLHELKNKTISKY